MCRNQFEPLILAGTKIHTIRGEDNLARFHVGQDLSLRVWIDKPYRSKQREFLRTEITRLEPITIARDSATWGGKTWSAAARRQRPHLERLAINDGFTSWEEMVALFIEMHKLEAPFRGALIHWRPPSVAAPQMTFEGFGL